VETKNDASPVTVADKNAETAMRTLVKRRYPSHAIFGEEHGIELGLEKSDDKKHEYLWVFDPIDGTKSFITGKPLWGTLIALLRDGEPVLGVLEQPVLKERWIGCKGTQTTFNGDPVSVHGDEQKELKEALMYSTTPLMFYDENEVRYERLKREVKIPMFGCDCYAYGLLASGFCDIVCEADLKPYDYMALVPIVLGAGGKMTDWEGEPLKFVVEEEGGDGESFQGEVLAAASERLWKASVASLKKQTR
jgi:inositol-phosphate phosphatase/L-galactose 1-phosphate phosphatase/histidinol-phosphatase